LSARRRGQHSMASATAGRRRSLAGAGSMLSGLRVGVEDSLTQATLPRPGGKIRRSAYCASAVT
jgi:hypothetical protein